MTEISTGDIVLSLAGHDKGSLLVVLSEEGALLRLADGNLRKVEKPKLKKRKHVQLAAKGSEPVTAAIRAGTIENFELRRALAPYKRETLRNNAEGGNYHGKR